MLPIRYSAMLITAILMTVVLPAIANCETLKRDRFLLLDDRVIERTANARLAVGQVTKSQRNPLFVEDNPWEVRFDNLYANVLYDKQERLYKCWYSPFIVDRSAKGMTFQERLTRPYTPPKGREMGVCYAVSDDGLTWRRPNMGLVEFNGSKDNNLVYRKSSETEHEPHGAGVFQDLRDPDTSRRYKMFFKGDIISVAFSPDGIHWGAGIACPEANVEGDTHNNAFWAPTRSEYVGITRTWAAPRGRQVARTASKDFLNWSRAEVVLEGLEDHLQTYAMPVFYHGGVYLGLVAIFNTETDRVHTELTWSPDTIDWHRVEPGQPLVRNSDQDGAYDWGCVYTAACPIIEKEHIRLYYGGSDGPHFGYRNGSLCLATLRPDGFAGYVPLDETDIATITTKPVQPSGTLRINADVDKGGFVTIRLLSESGKELARANPIINDQAIDTPIQWKSGFRISEMAEPVQLEFEFTKAKLYSFSWY